MIEKDLENWAEFEAFIGGLEAERQEKSDGSTFYISELLYRGQENSDWELLTTLERYFQKEVALNTYYEDVFGTLPRVVSFTGKEWELPDPGEYSKVLKETKPLFLSLKILGSAYKAYLRHHGFPSPLLDWTMSPYIAAFFAFRSPPKEATQVSVYIYQEYSEGSKGVSSDEPVIHNLNQNSITHKRHFIQQSQYTFCTILKDDVYFYSNHQHFTQKHNDGQDLLWKLNLPVSERHSVLFALDKMNINAFSLFGTEDSLMETIANKDIFFPKRHI